MIAAAKKPLPPPPPPVAATASLDEGDGLVLTPGEIKIGHTLETIRAALRGSAPTDFEYSREVLLRTRHRRDLAAHEVRRFKETEDVEGDAQARKTLTVLTRLWHEADLAVGLAARLATEAEEATR